MAKKTRKALKQQSYQRAVQQSVANLKQTTATAEDRGAEPVAVRPTATKPTSGRISGLEISAEQEFNYVRSDVRKSFALAAVFSIIMVALSFVIK